MEITHKLKRSAAIAVISMLACRALADGTVAFNNFGGAFIYLYTDAIHNRNLVTSATLGSQDSTATGYGSTGFLDAALVWGTTASSVSTIYSGTLAGIERIGAVPGELAGNAIFTVTGTVPGNSYYFQVYFWDSSFGDSLAGLQACVASGGYFGAGTAGDNPTYGAVGAPISVAVAPDYGPGTPIFGASINAPMFGRTVILDAPEPGTLLLTASGTVGLLLLGRRKLKA